jgi:hypothetical protein
VSLVFIAVLRIVVTGSPELRRRGRPPHRALHLRHRSGVHPGALVEFTCLCATSRCNPCGEWGTLAPNPIGAGDSAAVRRRLSPVGRRRPRPHAT